ncbi:hypothetical protein FOZ63_003409, partial [Perkinsus olseni]
AHYLPKPNMVSYCLARTSLKHSSVTLAILIWFNCYLVSSFDPVSEAIAELKGKLPEGSVITKNIPDPAFPRFASRNGIIPAAMVFPNNSDEVVSALTICHKHKVPVAIRSGIGHSYIGQSTVNNGVVLNMQRLKGFDVSGVGQYIVKMGAGLDTIEVYTLMGLHVPPLAFPGGSHATVGIAGYFSGGGQSVLGPKYGVAVDRLVAAEVVVYDKPSGAFKVVKATLSEGYEDLLFAVRGGMGGNYAVVLNFYYEAYPATRVLFSSGSMNNYVVGTYATRVREYMKFMADESTPADFGSTLLFRSTTNMSLSYYYSLCLCSPDGDCSVCDEVTSRFRKRTGTTYPTFFLPDTEEMSLVRAQWTQMNCGS